MSDINIPLLRKTMEYIKTHPEQWDQGSWYAPADEDVVGISSPRITPTGNLEWTVTGSSQEICGTAFCFAGHAASLSGVRWYIKGPDVFVQTTPENCITQCQAKHGNEHPGVPCHMDIAEYAEKELGLTQEEAESLFSGMNELCDLQQIVAELIKKAES